MRMKDCGHNLLNKPLIYDLFSGAGGAAQGYMNAGFRVIGIDNHPQPRYIGERFIQMDAFEFLERLRQGEYESADAIHASPPCQGYSVMNNLPWLKDKEYPLLILPTIELLELLGKPFVLENVMGARNGAKGLKKRGIESHGLKAGWLCGQMFGLPFPRHRLFATSFFWLAPGHPKHALTTRHGHASGWTGFNPGSGLKNWQDGGAVGVGHAKGWRVAAEAMGIDWMKQAELTQAIPPVYTEYIGKRLIEAMK